MGNKWDDFASDKDPEYWDYNRALIADSGLSDKEKIKRIQALDDTSGNMDTAELADSEDSVEEDGGEGDAELSALQSNEKDYYAPEGGDGNILKRSRKRRRRIGFIIGMLFPIPFLVGLLIMSGPMKLIQFGKMFERFHMGSNQTSTNSAFGRFVEFYRTAGPEGDKSKRNMGIIGEAVSSRQQANLRQKGIEINYGRPNGAGNSVRMQGMTIDGSTPEGRRTLDALKAEGFNVPEPDSGTGKTTVDLRNDGASARTRRRALNVTIDVQGKGKIASAISKRLLRARAGVDFHPIKNTRRDLTERFEDWRNKRKDERSKRHQTGVYDQTNTGTEGKKDVVDDGNGGTTEQPNAGNEEGAQQTDKTKADLQTNSNSPDGRSKSIKSLKSGFAAKSAGVAGAVVGLLCMARDIGDSIPAYQHANVILPMIRVGFESVAVAAQIQAFMLGVGPPPSLDELRMLSEEMDGIPIAEDNTEPTALEISNSKPALNAESIERQNGVAVGGEPAPKELDLSGVGEKPWLFRGLDTQPLSGALGITCGAINGVLGAVKKIPIVGWGVSKLEEAQDKIINGGLEIAFGTNMDEIFGAIISFVSGGAVDVRVLSGASLGSAKDAGVFLGEKEQALALGGTTLSPVAYQEVRDDAWYFDQLNQDSKSLFAKTIDIRDPDSLLAQATGKLPSVNYDGSAMQNIASLSLGMFKNVGSISSIFTPKVKAQGAPIPVDYGIEISGWGLSELESETIADPYLNADIIEPQLAVLNSRYEGCFGTVVDANTLALRFVESPTYSDVPDDKGVNNPACKEGGETLLRYRAYLLYTVTLRSVACYEGVDEQSCTEIGIEGSQPAAGGTAGGPTNQNLPEFASTAACPSDPDVTDAGITTGIRDGVTVEFRLCNVLGTARVNTTYATNFLGLFRGARAAGFDLTGGSGSYLSSAGAVARWEERCGSLPVTSGYSKPPCEGAQIAPPGRSFHEIGLAVDLMCDGASLGGHTTTRAAYNKDDPCVTWVRTNSPQLGLILQCERVREDGTQSDKCESWHISPTGG